VAGRLAELCLQRQVIVFTHDVWFVEELLGRMGSDRGCYSYYNVIDRPTAGVVVAAGEQEPTPAQTSVPAVPSPAELLS
jgi:hypothetical protein